MSRGKITFKRGCHPRNNLVKEQIGDLAADSHSTLSRRKKFCWHL